MTRSDPTPTPHTQVSEQGQAGNQAALCTSLPPRGRGTPIVPNVPRALNENQEGHCVDIIKLPNLLYASMPPLHLSLRGIIRRVSDQLYLLTVSISVFL